MGVGGVGGQVVLSRYAGIACSPSSSAAPRPHSHKHKSSSSNSRELELREALTVLQRLLHAEAHGPLARGGRLGAIQLRQREVDERGVQVHVLAVAGLDVHTLEAE
jgi:hypothetical protein